MFENFLNYKELHKILSHHWIKMMNKTESKKKKPLIELQHAVCNAIKNISGLKSKDIKQKWFINITQSRDALYYLLALLEDLHKN